MHWEPVRTSCETKSETMLIKGTGVRVFVSPTQHASMSAPPEAIWHVVGPRARRRSVRSFSEGALARSHYVAAAGQWRLEGPRLPEEGLLTEEANRGPRVLPAGSIDREKDG